MAVNIDEGEPGTFKDRWYLERDPHRFLEGLLVAAQVVGCTAVYIYLRDEYHHARRLLQALAALRANPPCPLPHIELRRGAGAYICGEESAMIESIEGKRGEPRLRPPYIARWACLAAPRWSTTLKPCTGCATSCKRAATGLHRTGRHGRKGLRSFSVSGRVKLPGVKLAPAGITLRELIDEFCGGMAEGHDPVCLPARRGQRRHLARRLADVPLDFDTLQPHGSFIGSRRSSC
jgi:NADH:ubiquinone oxidoreductase subunit F (NADH-binding)